MLFFLHSFSFSGERGEVIPLRGIVSRDKRQETARQDGDKLTRDRESGLRSEAWWIVRCVEADSGRRREEGEFNHGGGRDRSGSNAMEGREKKIDQSGAKYLYEQTGV